MDCGFESDCCWANVANGDQLDWQLVEGEADEKILESKFGNGEKPSENSRETVACIC